MGDEQTNTFNRPVHCAGRRSRAQVFVSGEALMLRRPGGHVIVRHPVNPHRSASTAGLDLTAQVSRSCWV
ncbi:hypothetical protein [Deinococcus radiotolerans]|uniref:hypothetical protein n=1 Tax=Deinococcus radiotolerans TaxID=1309407 RepID=UPI00166E7C3D|nr:hypothetical protein [Deinococcus radiotolerans]